MTADTTTSGLRARIERELALLLRHRRILVGNTSVVVVAGFVVSLFVGDQFRASARILPPPPPGSGSIEEVMRYMPVTVGTGVITVMDEIASVVESRRVLDPVIEAENLRSAYNAPTTEHAYLMLIERLDVEIGAAQILRLTMRDRDPDRAAAILSAVLEELNRFYVEARRTRGRHLVELIEARIDSTRRRLVDAQLALGDARSSGRAGTPSDATSSALGELMVRAYMLDIEIDALSSVASASTPAVARRRAELESITDELRRQPERALAESRLARELTVQQSLLDLLTAQLEGARTLEARSVPYIDVLDEPVPPPVRFWPGHVQIVAAAFVVSLAGGLLAVHAVDFVERHRAGVRAIGSPAGREPGSNG
jgi:uncharacterized protein involved in exopolysaccharide biosynthesis